MTFIKRILVRLLKSSAGRYYKGARLSKAQASSDPVRQFADWFELARQIDPDFADAMTLSTATQEGRPSNRLVLLKSFDQHGFVFYTNYQSRKCRELEANPRACLLFWWKEVYRQIRIEGRVEKLSAAESDAYFQSRARGSQLGAWASRQSSVIANRAELETALQSIEERFQKSTVDRPPHWGGYRVVPDLFEFWQGRADRLHDRLRYTPNQVGSWTIERLAP